MRKPAMPTRSEIMVEMNGDSGEEENTDECSEEGNNT